MILWSFFSTIFSVLLRFSYKNSILGGLGETDQGKILDIRLGQEVNLVPRTFPFQITKGKNPGNEAGRRFGVVSGLVKSEVVT